MVLRNARIFNMVCVRACDIDVRAPCTMGVGREVDRCVVCIGNTGKANTPCPKS